MRFMVIPLLVSAAGLRSQGNAGRYADVPWTSFQSKRKPDLSDIVLRGAAVDYNELPVASSQLPLRGGS
jgi:hypothetical protein